MISMIFRIQFTVIGFAFHKPNRVQKFKLSFTVLDQVGLGSGYARSHKYCGTFIKHSTVPHSNFFSLDIFNKFNVLIFYITFKTYINLNVYPHYLDIIMPLDV